MACLLRNTCGRLFLISRPVSFVVGTRRSQSTIPLVTASQWWEKCDKVNVLGETMSYYDSDPEQRGSDHAVVFLHGNPTSSYLWRNVIPRVEPVARCLAPDLVGHGRSSKLANKAYHFLDHYRYLSAWFDAVSLPAKVSIVCHDWGSGLGLHWSSEHGERMEGLVHMESFVGPIPGWDTFPDIGREPLQALRSEAGEQLIREGNVFVEQFLSFGIMRKMSEEEMEAYRAPFRDPDDRQPTLTWPRLIPVVGDGPDDMIAIVAAYADWVKTKSANLPKLYISAKPGVLSPVFEKMVQEWPNQKIVECEGLHFIQEDSPIEIGDYIKAFLTELYK
ncbi:coelenterazine h 2-monooxygenase-like [Diadema setosum]|uniref:coelenterazine h 2-monooxygenase-like n=1 Tax=Diadema setosum TaxID=31175 RepID=UPI003B3BDC8E